MNVSSLVQSKNGTELAFGTTSAFSILPGVLQVLPELPIETLELFLTRVHNLAKPRG